MTSALKVEREVHFSLQGRGRKEMRPGQEPKVSVPPGRVPRVARLMALAIRYDQLLRDGQIKDYTELARLGHVTRTRVCQVMNLAAAGPGHPRGDFVPAVDGAWSRPYPGRSCFQSLRFWTGGSSGRCARKCY